MLLPRFEDGAEEDGGVLAPAAAFRLLKELDGALGPGVDGKDAGQTGLALRKRPRQNQERQTFLIKLIGLAESGIL